MLAKDFRNEAWGKLRGKWGTVVVAELIYTLIIAVCGALARYFVGGFAMLLVTGPFMLSWAIIGLAVIRKTPFDIATVFAGFKDYGRAFVLGLINTVFIALWSILLVIPGIIKAYSYSMSFYILADNPELTANEARKRSMALMKGNKWRLFCLHFSFIGWLILCGITCGILSLWIIPYMQAAQAAFYQNLIAPAGAATPGEAPAAEIPGEATADSSEPKE